MADAVERTVERVRQLSAVSAAGSSERPGELERVELALDSLDDAREALFADIGRAEAIDAGIGIAIDRRDQTNEATAPINMAAYIEELSSASDSDLQAVAALLRETYENVPPTATTADAVIGRLDSLAVQRELAALGLASQEAFRGSLANEIGRHRRSQDSFAAYVVEADGLDSLDELRLVRAMREFAMNPGDMLGRTESGYAILLPWVDPSVGQSLGTTLTAMVRGAIPGHTLRVGAFAGTPDSRLSSSFSLPEATAVNVLTRRQGRSR